MIEALVVTETYGPYSKFPTCKYGYMPTGWRSLDELIAYYKEQGCDDMGIAYSGISGEYVTYHFPATARGRAIYRMALPEDHNMGVGIAVMCLGDK